MVFAALLAGCSHKTDANTELQKAATALAQGDNTQAAPAPAVEPPPPPAVEASAPPEPPPVQAPNASQQMQAAIASYNTGQLEDAVTRLQRLRAMPTLTAQQRMAVQDGVAAVMSEVYALAAKGDARAIAAVKQYEQMQTAARR